MMAGNPNWWSMHHPQSSHQLSVSSSFVYGGGGSNITSSASANNPNLNQDFPIRSWSQFILGEGRYGDDDPFQQQKNWEEQVSILNPYSSLTRQQVPIHADVKQEQLVQSGTCHLYDARRHDETISYVKNTDHDLKANSSYEWPPPQQTNQLTTSGNSFLDFVQGNKNQNQNQHQHQHNQDQSSECNSTINRGGVSIKKARFQQSSSQPALKVRKEKLGDRITALHQLVSPFGKTDTASVLSEAICCIRYLQSQIEALSTPYMMRNANSSATSASTSHHQRSEFQSQRDLRSRGMCLVPISCTQNVGNDGNAADYWAPNYH